MFSNNIYKRKKEERKEEEISLGTWCLKITSINSEIEKRKLMKKPHVLHRSIAIAQGYLQVVRLNLLRVIWNAIFRSVQVDRKIKVPLCSLQQGLPSDTQSKRSRALNLGDCSRGHTLMNRKIFFDGNVALVKGNPMRS